MTGGGFYQEEELEGKFYDAKLTKRLLKYLRPYTTLVIFTIGIMIISSLLALVQPYLFKLIIDNSIGKGNLKLLVSYSFVLFAVLFARFLTVFFEMYYSQYLGERINIDIRNEIFSKIIKLDIKYFDKNPTGRILTRMTSDVDALNELFTSGFIPIFSNIITLVGILCVLFYMSVKLSLLSLVIVPPSFILTLLFRIGLRKGFRATRLAISKLNTFLAESLAGIKDIQLFTAEEQTYARFKKLNENYYNTQKRVVIYHAIYWPLIDIFTSIATSLIIYYGGASIIAGRLSFGTLFAFITYIDMFYGPIKELADKFNILQSAMAAAERIFKLLDEPILISSPVKALSPPKTIEQLKFENVYFAYDDKNFVLKNITFELKRGEKLAIVGFTGAGKTSIINLLFRYYDPQKGKILINGVDIREYDIEKLREKFALVAQDVFLFSSSIIDNILMWKYKLTPEQLSSVLSELGAGNLANRLSEKIGERGATLSSGERQLISFARALVNSPELLVLDEATANIDPRTEKLIQRATEKVLEGRTAIIIAHRLSTIKSVDRIMVIHRGQIEEEGTLEDLLEKGGIFYKLYRLQYVNVDLPYKEGINVD